MNKSDYSCRRRVSHGSGLYAFHIGINNDDICCQGNHSSGEENVQSKRRGKWPTPVWLILKILCVFYHRKVTGKRICYSCYVKNVSYHVNSENGLCKETLLIDPICLEYEYDEKESARENEGGLLPLYRSDRTPNCDVCNMTLWNFLGEAKEYSDHEIGVSSWNSPYSKFISIVGVMFAMTVILYDFAFYIHRMLWDQHHLLHFIHYCGFLVCLSTYPVLNICSKIRSFCGQDGKFSNISWATTLNLRFIIKRLQVLDLHKKGLPGKLFLIVCLMWPSCNALYRFIIYTYIIKHHVPFHEFCTIAGTGAIMIMWGCFAYLLYLMRLSFQREFMLILNYFKKKEGDLDNCRNCLSHAILDFNCFRKFVMLYMAVMVPFTVLEVTTTVTWQYSLRDTCQYVESITGSSINILIWSNTAMFIVLNIIAIGGLDVNHVWDNFLLSIIQMQTAMHCSFWRKIFTHLKRNQGDFSTTNFTMVFSVISFYMGLQFGDQDIFYGQERMNCTILNVTDPTHMVGYTVF
ncbi:hypothetical protein HOLleu_17425 [Holothuria leucospilota]|uniref:Uncharacterized protein n=1 Tax=Holothuria leucospilota TaxID=206669 RepID=A0A9Q1C205_HOLLE|nr:hypothetical protein HOLleu_17425 [Holothuria leucospilota]